MGEGVLSLPQNGFPVTNDRVVSVSFSREHGFFGGIILPNIQAEEGDSLVSGRQDPVFTGAAFPTQASRVQIPKSWIPHLDISDLMESISGEKGGMQTSPHEGEKESPKTMTSSVHMKPTPSTGSTGLFTSGYASRYPDSFEDVNGGRSLGPT